MEQNMRFELVLGRLAVLKISDWAVEYRTRAIISRGLYTFYPLFEVHLCTVTFGLMYGL